MSNDYYKEGSWNVICDSCGKKRKREQVKRTWDGFMMCTIEHCWYPKHPNDMPRKIIPDGLPVPNARPRANIDDLPRVTWPGSGLVNWESTTVTWDTPWATWEDDISVLSLDDLRR